MILSWIVFLGATVRLPVIMNSSFPANDGGMFMQAIVQLKANHFVLPAYLHYNGLQLPYAYPPIGFYLAGFLSSVTHMSVLNTLRFVPLTFSVATIVAFIFFAKQLLEEPSDGDCRHHRLRVGAAQPQLGDHGRRTDPIDRFLLRVLAFGRCTSSSPSAHERTCLTIIFAALVCMSHLEMALFVAVSATVMLLLYARTRKGLRDAVLLGVGVVVATCPWWAVVVQRNGLAPFVSAGGTSERSIGNLLALIVTFNWADERLFPIFATLSGLGLIVSLIRRKFFSQSGSVLTSSADPRSFRLKP